MQWIGTHQLVAAPLDTALLPESLLGVIKKTHADKVGGFCEGRHIFFIVARKMLRLNAQCLRDSL